MNSTAMNIHVQIFECLFSALLGYKPRIGIARSYSSYALNFWRNHQTFFTVTASFYIPPAMYKGSSFPTTLPTLVISVFFNYSI